MMAAEWRVGIISFFPRARMQRSDLGSDCHSQYKYKPELDTLHPRIEDEVRLADTFGGALLCRKADQVFTALHRRHSGWASGCKHLLPDLTPVYLTFTMALELATAASHSSSTFRADPVQNAGDHFCTRFEPAQSYKSHLSPQSSHRALSIDRALCISSYTNATREW